MGPDKDKELAALAVRAAKAKSPDAKFKAWRQVQELLDIRMEDFIRKTVELTPQEAKVVRNLIKDVNSSVQKPYRFHSKLRGTMLYLLYSERLALGEILEIEDDEPVVMSILEKIKFPR